MKRAIFWVHDSDAILMAILYMVARCHDVVALTRLPYSASATEDSAVSEERI